VPDHRLLVVADAHIGAAPPEAEAALLAFLDAAPELGDALLVAGDLFEFWFAYRRVIPRRAFPVAAALARLATRFPVAMAGGNHDRWGDPFWAAEAGITYSARELTLDGGGRRVLALHGDGLTERPGRVTLVHRLIGHPLVGGTFRLLHPDLGMRIVDRIAPWLGEGVQDAETKRRGAARQQRWAEARLAADPSVGAIVMAHTHVPALFERPDGRLYLNPGAWYDGGRYAVIAATGAELRQFTPAVPPPPPTAAPR
jgi:UDP-2,3-diacylglucosamine hydrolase